MRKMSRMFSYFPVCFIGCVCFLASSSPLSSLGKYFDEKPESGNGVAIDEAAKNKVLQDFAIDSSLPRRGLNLISLTGSPFFSTYYVISYLGRNPEISVVINLRDEQNAGIENLRDYIHPEVHPDNYPDGDIGDVVFSLLDESKHPEVYSFLDQTQRHSAELIGLRLDGCSALARSYWVEHLDLDPQQVAAMQERGTDIRKTKVAARLRGSFAGIDREPERIFLWEATKDAVSYNLWAISILSESQKSKLAKYVPESPKYHSIVQEETQRSFGVHSK